MRERDFIEKLYINIRNTSEELSSDILTKCTSMDEIGNNRFRIMCNNELLDLFNESFDFDYMGVLKERYEVFKNRNQGLDSEDDDLEL